MTKTDEKQLASNLRKLPSMCFYVIEHKQPGERIIGIRLGEDGYAPLDKWSWIREVDLKATSQTILWETVNEVNARLGVTPAQAEAMAIGSMFGWHVPGADPDDETNIRMGQVHSRVDNSIKV